MANENINLDRLREHLALRRWDEFRANVATMDPADVADFVEDLPADEREQVFKLFDPETASDVLVEMEAPFVDRMVEEMESGDLARVAGRMAPDDAADFLSDLDDAQTEEVLSAMEPADQEEVRELLRYPEDSAGRLMTTEILSCPATATVAEVKRLAGKDVLSDPVLFCYVVEPEQRRLLGQISVQDLLHADDATVVGELAQEDYVFSTTDEDQEEVARKFRKYDLWVIPVVDARHRIVGRITVDDILDVLHEEKDEDLAHLVGAPDIEEEENSLPRITRLRLPWLLITMLAGLANSVIISKMMRVTNVGTLAIFVPAILAMGGNTGMQSSAICIRGIALDESKYSRLLTIMGREIRVGICLGIICGTITGCIVWGLVSLVGAMAGSLSPIRLGLTVGIAMCNAMAFASTFGAVVPILLHRMDIDPAVASGPFITTSNDLSATMIYFLTCALLLGVV